MNLSKRAWLALAAAVALLAGCGGGGDSSEVPGMATVLKAELSTFDGHGVWWNPAEPGTGFFFEAQGGTGVVTFYMYETNGRAVWYGAPGTFTAGTGAKYKFSGTLLRYQGGQPAGSTVVKTPTSTQVGPVTIDFDDEKATATLPGGRVIQAVKYYKRATTYGPPWHHPETGIYWKSDQSGRGYTIEIGNGTATVGVFHYADDGQPTWHLVAMSWPNDVWLEAKGDFMAYTGGQALTGAYKAPATSAAQGQLGLDFTATCQGNLRLPGLTPIQVQRFAFGSLPAGAECRQFPMIPATASAPVPATSYFSDVTLKLTTESYDSFSLSVGQPLPGSFSFSAAGGPPRGRTSRRTPW